MNRKFTTLVAFIIICSSTCSNDVNNGSMKKEIELRMNKATNYLKIGELDLAEQEFRTIIEIDPSIPDSFNNLGIILLNRNKVNEAVIYFTKSIEVDPFYSKGYFNLGVVYQNSNKLQEAERNYLKALDLTPTSIESIFNLGIVSERLGKKEKAVEFYQKFISLAPKVEMEQQIQDANSKIKALKGK